MPGVELDLPGPLYEPMSGSVGDSAGSKSAPSLPTPSPSSPSTSVPSVDPATPHSDDLDFDSGSEPDLDDVADGPEAPDLTPDLSNSDLPHPDFVPSPSASCTPSPVPSALSPSPSPVPPSNSRDSRTPPAPYVTRSGRSSHPMHEWWKVDHPYQHAKEQRCTRHSGSTPEATSEATLAALEEANSLRTLLDSELIEYGFLSSTAEPRTYKEAMKRDNSRLWQEASQQEYNAHLEHGVWELCELPPGWKAVGNCWVYRIKTNSDGTVNKYKARLATQGFSQKPHLDYTETFAPVAKFASLWVLLAIAAAEDMEVHHVDVSSAFLNGDLEEATYMAQLEGFVAPGQEHLVCHLKRSIYGLKQSPRQWYQKLHNTFTDLGFPCCASDHCVWIWAKDGIKVVIPAYVDDLTVSCNNPPAMK